MSDKNSYGCKDQRHYKTLPRLLLTIVLMMLLASLAAMSAGSHNKITILYDSFGKSNNLKQDWGFAAFIEFNHKKILFDTGNDVAIFKHNVETAKINLNEVDYAVISHRHNDHTTGLTHLFEINPRVPVYVPKESDEFFSDHLPGIFYSQVAELSHHVHVSDAATHILIASDSIWGGINFIPVTEVTEIAKGIYILPTTSDSHGIEGLKELSLALKTAQGLVLVVGCSHPGIENIVDLATSIDRRVYNIFGGFHLLRKSDVQLTAIAKSLKNTYGIQNIAPGHCTGKPAVALFAKMFGKSFIDAGLGTVITLPE